MLPRVTDERTPQREDRAYRIDLERQTYATIVVMSLLAVYSGWDQLSFLEAALVMLAPVLALATAHFFSEVLHEHAELRRPLRGHEWRTAAVRQVQLVLAAVPPLLMLVIGRSLDVDVERVTLVILATGVLTLMGLAGFAGRRAGLAGWRLVVTVLAGGLVGLIVLSIQILLKPS